MKERVAAKFADGDVSGPVRELSFSNGLAKQSEDTIRALRDIHSPAPRDLMMPETLDDYFIVSVVSEEDDWKAELGST